MDANGIAHKEDSCSLGIHRVTSRKAGKGVSDGGVGAEARVPDDVFDMDYGRIYRWG